MTQWLIYGANGYTGELIAREAVARQHAPILAGRNRESIESLAHELSLPFRVFGLDDPASLDAGLSDVKAVVHAAGPFVHTSRPMVDACLRTGTHYMDITGEISVFESIMTRDAEAKSAGVALIPGVGFDVVPTDCLAAMLHARMPDATHLELAFTSRGGGGISRGTLRTMIEGMQHGGAIRQDGRIISVPTAWESKDIPFDFGVKHAMTIPWGDVSTAWHSTKIPNIRVYSAASPRSVRRMRRVRILLPLLGIAPLRRLWQWSVRNRQGPDTSTRRAGSMHLWGEVSREGAAPLSMTMKTPEGYQLTAISAVSAVGRVLAGGMTGSLTPSLAFGAEFVLSMPGVSIAG